MANEVFNIAKGRVNEYVSNVANNSPANSALVVVLFRVSESDSFLRDYNDLAAIIAGSNTEANFTNYSRKVLTDADLTEPSADDSNDRQDADIPDQVWLTAGGTLDNTLTKLIICYDPDITSGTDADLIPLTHHDFTPSTNGNNLTAEVNAAGFYRAS